MNKTEMLNKFSTNDEERLLLARLLDKLTLADMRDIPAYTGFLSPKEQVLSEMLINACKVRKYIFYGGYDGAERNICVFLPQWQEPQDWISSEYCPLRVLRCFWPKEIELTHRDFLGAVLGLGIDREKIGDILVRDDKCDIIMLEDVAEYLQYNLLKVGRAHVKSEEIPSDSLCLPQKRTKIIKDTVNSLRLDAVAASGFSLARAKAAQLISAGRVQLNHLECIKPDRTVSAGDVISCKGYGKFILKQEAGTTKKGRIIIEIERYI